VNAGSLLGEDGRASRRTAETLVRAGMAHLIATDAHRQDKRRPLLSAALARVAKLTGHLQAMQTQVNAAAILQGRTLSLPDPQTDALRPRTWYRLSLRS
jgi:protein-tyrosine phosphatase